MKRPLPAGLHAMGFVTITSAYAFRAFPGKGELSVSIEWTEDTENGGMFEGVMVQWQHPRDAPEADPCVSFRNGRAALQLVEEVIAAGNPQPIIDHQYGRTTT